MKLVQSLTWWGGVVDGRQPTELHAEDDNQRDTREEGGHRVTHHRNERADLVENRILSVGGKDSYRYRNQDTNQVRQTHHPERLRQTFHDEIHHRTTRGPGANSRTSGRVTDVHPRPAFQEIERFVDDELFQPLDITKVKRLAQAQAMADFLAHLRGNGQWQLTRWISRCEIQEGKYDKTDGQQAGNGE